MLIIMVVVLLIIEMLILIVLLVIFIENIVKTSSETMGVQANSGSSGGGAIWNLGTIGDIDGDFIGKKHMFQL